MTVIERSYFIQYSEAKKRKQLHLQKSYFVLFIFLSLAFAMNAQRGGFPGQEGRGSGQANSPTQAPFVEYVDTFGVFYFHEDNPTQIYTVVDSSLSNFHRYDPAQQSLFAQANNGNIGSPTRPAFYESRYRQGFDVGLHQFDLYYIQPEDVRFYVLDKPYAKFRANIGNSQEDRMFQATFGRKFANGWHLNLDANSILQQSAWKFPNQQLSDRSLGIGLWHKAKSGRYDGFFTLTSNTTVADENGGIISPPPIDEAFTSPADAETILSGSGNTRHAHRTFGYTQYFKIRKRDSIPSNRREFTLSHQIQYRTSTYKYTDATGISDTFYYHSFLDDADERGLRFFLKHQAICNTFKLGTYRNSKATAETVKNQRDKVEFGFIHRLHFLDNEVEKFNLNNLFVTGRFDFRLKERIAVKSTAHYGLSGYNSGDYRISGDLFFDIGKIGQLSGKAVLQAYEPSFLQQQLIVTQGVVWENSFGKTTESSLSANYKLPALNLELGATYRLLDNYIYLQRIRVPDSKPGGVVSLNTPQAFEFKQLDGLPLSIVQFTAVQRLKLGAFRLNNLIGLQAHTTSVIRLPTWLSRHSVYVESKLFKSALKFQLGADLSMNAPYLADSYQALIGQFYLQSAAKTPFYPALDAFLNVNVKTVRVYVNAQNITHLLADKYYYNFYQTHNYPQLPFFISFGLDWVMRN